MLDHTGFCHLHCLRWHFKQCNDFVIILSLQQQFSFEVNISAFPGLDEYAQHAVRYDRVELELERAEGLASRLDGQLNSNLLNLP